MADVVDIESTSVPPRGGQIMKKVERQFLKECIRSISNTLELYMYQKEACINQLREVLDISTMEENQELINTVIKARHSKVLESQRSKFDKLYQQKTGGHSSSQLNIQPRSRLLKLWHRYQRHKSFIYNVNIIPVDYKLP